MLPAHNRSVDSFDILRVSNPWVIFLLTSFWLKTMTRPKDFPRTTISPHTQVLVEVVHTRIELGELQKTLDVQHQRVAVLHFFVVAAVRGDRLEAHLTEEETGRVGLSCHFALDCMCESLLPISALFRNRTCEHPLFSPFTRLVNVRFPAGK